MTVLAIDQGTSATKAIVVDPAGGVIAVAEEEVRPVYLPGGGVEQDPEETLQSLLRAGNRALERAGRPVRCVALANQGETVLAWDPASGRPLSQAVVWQDRRSEAWCRRHSGERERIAHRTGLVLDPYFSAPKMAWLRENVTTEGVVTTADTWILHRLTGEFVTDAATASRSLLVALGTAEWDIEMAALFGLEDGSLPRIVACDEIVGTTTAFGAETPVGGLVVDQQAALLAEGGHQPGIAKCTFGTGAFMLASTGAAPLRSTAGLTSSVAWRVRDASTYCIDGQVLTAASAVRWLQNLGFIRSAADLDAVAASDVHGTLCVPALAGLAAPWWRADAAASFSGMTLSTRPEHLVLAVLQGIAAQVAQLADLVGADIGAPLTRLRVDGGLTQSAKLMQATADITQLPIDVFPSAHATALGVAALARLAGDRALGIDDAVTPWIPETTYEPQWSADRAGEHRRRWLGVVTASLDGLPGHE